MGFNTPTLLAMRLSDEPELEEGETGPLKLECAPINDLMNPAVYVVKFKTTVAAQGLGIVSEIIASYLANFFGIATPEFALVEISEAFVQSAMNNFSTPAHILTSINQNKHALNFGSKLVSMGTNLPMSMRNMTYEQLQMAENIFAFDALLYNADRTNEVPNVFVTKDAFIVYDHEKAFNFLFSKPINVPNNFRFQDLDGRMFMPAHIFRSSLQGRQLTFDNFIDMLGKLDDDIIEDIVNQVPYNLAKTFADDISAIRAHLVNARNDTKGFRYGLMRVLV